ncbi:MAG: hypothetical protein JXA90_09050 [Planctomycetes bacterium]|nr:hypothetical protein [Planctomycetota bacterium]
MIALSLALAYLGTLAVYAFRLWLAARLDVAELAEEAREVAGKARVEAAATAAELAGLMARVRNLELKNGLSRPSPEQRG